jgi:hypothetical protein
MSTKRRQRFADVRSAAIDLAERLRRLEPPWTPDAADPAAVSTALAVTVALVRALRDRGLLSDGEIDDLFGEAATHLRDTSGAQNLLNRLRSRVEHKDEE